MVFVDTESTVYDASLSLTNIEGKNNKFYYIQLLNGTDKPSYYAVWTHWGRVGESTQNKLKQNLSLDEAKTSRKNSKTKQVFPGQIARTLLSQRSTL